MKTQTNEKLSPGDDVFIRGDEEDRFYGMDGTIKEITKENKAVVHFYKKFAYLFGFTDYYHQNITTCEFELDKLEKFNLDERPEIKVERLFPDFYHHLYGIPYKFSPKNLCMHKDCSEKATKRILYNCWGTVCEYDVCEEHNKDGYCGDGFPMRHDYEAEVKETN